MVRRGFTLLEVLIVVVIIGILASMVALRYDGVQDSAFMTSAKDIEKRLEAGATMYVSQYSRPPSSFYSWVAVGDGGTKKNYVRLGGPDIRLLMKNPQTDVLQSGNTIRLEYKNGLVAEYRIDSNGKITATYSGPGSGG